MTSNYYSCIERKLVGILEGRQSSFATPTYILDLIPSDTSVSSPLSLTTSPSTPSTSTSLAAVLSSGVVKLFDTHSLKQTFTLNDPLLKGSRCASWIPRSGAKGLLIGCGASVEDSDMIIDDSIGSGIKYVTEDDIFPSVHFIDLRASLVSTKPLLSSATLLELSGGKKQLSSIAASENDSHFAVAFGSRVAIFDIRKSLQSYEIGKCSSLIASYEESHSETVNQVAFHPFLRGHVMSGGDDGLICVFDINRIGEDEALVSVLSVGSSVRRFGLFGEKSAHAFALTRTEGVSVWNIGSSSRVADFSDLRSQLLAKGTQLDYLIECKELNNETLVSLSGNDDGDLALIEVSPSGCVVQKFFERNSKGHSATVRSAAWIPNNDVLFTGGEDGVVCAWRRGTDEIGQVEDEMHSSARNTSVMRREKIEKEKIKR
jgi:WD40 repeat protein